MILPRETAWFGYYDKDLKTLLNYNETDLYKNDYIGIRELNENGKIDFVGLPGNHLQFSDDDILKYFIPALS
jgi:palmitoyl-protein thioesterase